MEPFQSAMKCTNVTGKAPLLIGSPSMWPSCEEGRREATSEDDKKDIKEIKVVVGLGFSSIGRSVRSLKH